MNQEREDGDDAREHREADEDALGHLRAQVGHNQEREDHRAEDRADGVGGIDAADEPAGILPASGDTGECQGEARAPQERAGRTAQKHCARLSWKLNKGRSAVRAGLTGQKGRRKEME